MNDQMRQLGKFKTLTPETNEAFQALNKEAFQDGALSKKLKELMAVACAATTGCEVCLDLHSDSALAAGASEKEVAEALMIATAGKAGAIFAHASNAFETYEETGNDEYYKRSYLAHTMDLGKLTPASFKHFYQFTSKAVEDGELSAKEKELIIVAVLLITGCPYCIDTHVKNAKKAGASKEEISEAIFVASVLNAGSALSKSPLALQKFDE